MNDADIQVFITGVLRYFEALESEAGVFIEPPFIKDQGKPFREYSGTIRVSGKSSGIVCFTASKTMLEAILKHLNQDPAPEAVSDLVGEIANTLSGNAREEFGHDFMISVPIVSVGDCDESALFPKDTRNYVIPVVWHAEKAFLLVALT
jgi:chemotaxis protein CheX